MTFTEIAMRMWPMWCLGAFMVWATAKSEYKELVRVDKKAVVKWSIFLLGLTLYRVLTLKWYAQSPMYKEALANVSIIPWQATLTVFWEDACHGLPLVLLRKFIGTKWFTWPVHFLATAMVMLSFGSGHVYQGMVAAALLMLYIPMSIRAGKQYGFGTVMIAHTLYDLSTILAIKWMIG